LWQQYHEANHNTQGIIPHTQPFETEVVWLYQRYKYKTSKKNPPKDSQYTLPQNILDSLTESFNISHSYFPSPVSCSTRITQYYSPFTRDKVFGSLGTAFQYKWKGIGYAHPPNEEMAQQAIHWARLAAKNDPTTITILVIPDINWYQNYSPHSGPFPDTHIIAHFAADTITYDEPTKYQDLNKTRTEPLAIHILCTHHQNHNIGTTEQIATIKTIIENLQITHYHIQNAPPTPYDTPVNKNPNWNKLLYPPPTISPATIIPPAPNYEIHTTLKFPPQYSYYTDGSFIPPKKN